MIAATVSYKQARSFSYEELFGVVRQLRLKAPEAMQLLRRLIFNIISRNHDDHSKNFGFMMNDAGVWSLSPAYDIAYSYKPDSHWVSCHWMTLNGKRDHFERSDFYSLSTLSPLFTKKLINETIDEITLHVSTWRTLATEQAVPLSLIDEVESNLRLNI